MKANVVTEEDVDKFSNFCVYVRSVYEYATNLYEPLDPADSKMLQEVAPIFFGDLRHIIVEYLILQVCKITDPAEDGRGNVNHTVEFFAGNASFGEEPVKIRVLAALAAKMVEFSVKLRPARNKLVSHLDRKAILADKSLGAASNAEWDQFWGNLQTFVHLLCQEYLQQSLWINSAGHTSDVPMLLKTLRLGSQSV